MHKIIFTALILTTSLIANSQNYCDFIQNVQNYQGSVKLKHSGGYDVINQERFDVNSYLSLFDDVMVENEYKIDVCFFDNFFDGKPYLYALKNNQGLSDENRKSLYEFLNKADTRAKSHIVPKDSESGFLQYLFFFEMGEQFALKWHAMYNEKYIICSKKKLDEVVNKINKYNQTQKEENESEIPAYDVDIQLLEKFSQINPAVEIELTSEFCSITWIENRTHSGIYRCKYKIQRQFPYGVEKISEERLLEIKIGFIY